MSATSIWADPRARAGRRSPAARLLLATLGLAAALVALSSWPVLAGDGSPSSGTAVGPPDSEAQRVERLFSLARERYQTNPTNAEAAWQYGRACFDQAEIAPNNTRRAVVAREGIAACRRSIALDPRFAAGHYYLGLNLGQLARTETLGALKLVKEMEAAFKAAIELDPRFDYAGPHRSLGLLYQDAPGWPASIGSRAKARQQLQRAVELAPGYPDNHLCLLEAYLDWGEHKAAQAEAKPTEDALRQARTELAGASWEASWKDWESRFAKARSRATPPGSRAFRSPRDQ